MAWKPIKNPFKPVAQLGGNIAGGVGRITGGLGRGLSGILGYGGKKSDIGPGGPGQLGFGDYEFSSDPELERLFKQRYATESADINKQTGLDIGAARGSALERGLTGDPFEALATQAARNQGATNLARLRTGLGSEAFNIGEDRRRRQQEIDLATAESRRQRKSSMFGDILSAAATLGGAYLGGPAGAAAGGYFSKLFQRKPKLPTYKPSSGGGAYGNPLNLGSAYGRG